MFTYTSIKDEITVLPAVTDLEGKMHLHETFLSLLSSCGRSDMALAFFTNDTTMSAGCQQPSCRRPLPKLHTPNHFKPGKYWLSKLILLLSTQTHPKLSHCKRPWFSLSCWLRFFPHMKPEFRSVFFRFPFRKWFFWYKLFLAVVSHSVACLCLKCWNI